MNVSEFCIRHPVATILMSAALILGGLFSYSFLPVAALPRTDFPVINVSANLPGASPETMANAVATPLIKQFATIAGIQSITTTNAQGFTSISIEFDLNRNIDAAAADVQSAIARTLRRLPPDMTDPPSYRKVNPADAPVLLLAIKSSTTPMSKLDDFAQQVMSPALSTISGVAQVSVFGSQKFAVRIQIDPNELASRGIGIDEIQTAVSAANDNTPVGTVQGPRQNLTIQAETQLSNAEQFGNLIVATRNGRSVRLRDVAHVIDSVENTQTGAWNDGQRSILLAIQRQPDANTVEVVDRVKAMIPTFEKELPSEATISSINDRSQSIRAAVEDVQFTLALTIALVILVIFIFLRRVTATIIPSLAVPISLIATLGGMYLFGFSIDNISLLGLTLAVGLVVDDAIVMLENIVRHMEEDGLGAFEAALKGSREIGFTIVSITISLIAVFIPVLLMGGVVGRVFFEFAVVVTTSLAASAFVSLTLTPMLCSRLLKAPANHDHTRKPGWLDRILEGFFDAMLTAYSAGLRLSLHLQPLMLILFLGTVAGTAYLFYVIPKGFFPQEDIGQLQVTTEARPDVSYQDMVTLQAKVETIFRASPYIAHVASNIGASGFTTLSSGRMFIELKPKDERPNLDIVMGDLRRQLSRIPGITTYMIPVQNIRVGGRQSRAAYQFVLQSLNQKELYAWSAKMRDAMAHDSKFADVNSDLQDNAIQATLRIDKDKANALGISTSKLRSTLYAGFGTLQISTIYATGDSNQVLLEFDPRIPWTPALLDDVKIRSSSGKLVPIGAFATVERTAGPLTINQLGQLPAVTLSFNLPAGVSLGDAVARTEILKQQIGLPSAVTTSFAGTAQVFQQSLANQTLLIAAAILAIYIVLGILYESFVHPLTILTGLPSAVLGALLTLYIFRLDLSVIALIGILMLIGIVKKNAIMMIDVALVLQREGAQPQDAIYRACLMRFRPIMMTTFAALMGVLPIAVGHGASAELRQPLGLAVVGGLIVSQALTLFITPVLYLYMERLSQFLLHIPHLLGKRPQSTHNSGTPQPAPAE